MSVGKAAAGVFVTIDAKVVATASSTGSVGVVFLDGIEQDVKVNNKTIIKKCLMHRLYSFSEQIKILDVIRVKERE
jgi:hypothetical protein